MNKIVQSVQREVFLCAQVLGDRSLKLKYLNPNMLFVATGSQPGQAMGGARHITAHIFDTVTGQLLFSQTHEVRGSTHPAHVNTPLALLLSSICGGQ